MYKFKLFIQKSLFRLTMLLALVCFIGVFVYAVKIDQSDKGPKDMRLPNAEGLAKPVLDGVGVKTPNPLTIQHMGSREVGMLLNDMIAESLTFDKTSFRKVITEAKKNFTPEGYEQYSQFIANSGFEAALSTGDLHAGSYVDGEPVELGKGVYSDVFKWVFEVPVTISLIPRNAETYRNDATKAQNRNFILRAQMARVNDPQDPNAVKIELWQVLPPRPKK